METTTTTTSEAPMTNTLDTLKAHAAASHADYGQYDGYFDGYELYEVTRRIRTKGGTDLRIGDLVIADPELEDMGDFGEKPLRRIYDPATTHNVLVDPSHVTPAAAPRVTTRHANGLVWMTG